MKQKYKFYFVGVFVGAFLGSAIGQPLITKVRELLPHVYISTTDWRGQADLIRDAWLKDRQDWRDGKPFEVRHSRHHQTW